MHRANREKVICRAFQLFLLNNAPQSYYLPNTYRQNTSTLGLKYLLEKK